MLLGRPLLPACPLCGSHDRRYLRAYERAHLGQCRRCRFIYSPPVPSAADLEANYAHYDYAFEDDRRTAISIAKERALADLLARYRQTGRVLDVAAGAGRFLEHFAAIGFACYATEFNEKMCGYLESKGFTAYRGGTFPQGAPADAFDVIVFTEIIEHIQNPREVLTGLVKLLRPGGAIYITTPNWASLERRLFKDKWGMLMWPEHLTYWTPRHLHRALSGAGLRKRSLRAQGVSPYRIIQALRPKTYQTDREASEFSDRAQAAVAGNPALRLAKRAVNAALIAGGLGSSIEALYERPGS